MELIHLYNGNQTINDLKLSPITPVSTPLINQEELWLQILNLLSKKIKKHALQTWLSGATLKEIVDDYAVIAVKNDFSRNFISQTYSAQIEEALREITARNLGVRFVVDENLDLNQVANIVASEATQISLGTVPQPRFKNDPASLKNSYTLENFISNSANRLALLFTKAFIDAKSNRYRSLYIHGGTGLGKTHLLHAIANARLAQNPNLKVKYISTESFANELFQAIRNKNTAEFHAKYRKIDLLLLDDAQFLENKKSTQEEFYYTFEAITNAGGKVVMAASKNPNNLVNIEANLKSRLTGSLVTEIFDHDFDARMEILKAKTKQDKTPISNEHLEFIALRTQGSVRDLEAALNKLSLFNEFGHLDDESIVDLFGYSRCSSGAYKGLDIEKISEVVAAYCGVALNELRSPSRVKELAKARHISIYLCRELLQISHERIGKYFSGRKHSSIIHSINLIKGEISRDRSMALVIEDIKAKLCG